MTNFLGKTLNKQFKNGQRKRCPLTERQLYQRVAMRILTNICSEDLQKSKEFYVELLGFNVKYDSDWYVQLCSPEDPEIEYGIIQRNHELVPLEYQSTPTGMYVTFVVNDVDLTYKKALDMGLAIFCLLYTSPSPRDRG